jgi:hypothetical protein
VLKAFVDDSGSGGDSPWVVLAGYVGTVADWEAFDPEWRAVLDTDPRIEYFKSSEAESLKEQFSRFSKEERNTRIDSLIAVIARRARLAISVRLRQKDYEEIVKQNVPPLWDDPYFFLFPAFITAATAVERFAGAHELIEFVFDSSQKLDGRSRRLYEQMMEMDRYKSTVANVLYRDDKKFLPLQAADLLAWQTRRAFCAASKESRRAHYDKAKECQWAPFCHILTKDELEICRRDMEANARRFAQALGVPLEMVRPWQKG